MSAHGKHFLLCGKIEEISPLLFADNTFDACFCDPPYLLEFMGKEFDRQHKKEMGNNDGQRMQRWHERWTREVYRVLKPGGYILVFGGTRTVHRLASAMEDVGFEIRDTLCWLQGQGFPKGYNIENELRKRAAKMAEHDLRFVQRTYLSAPVYSCAKCSQVLLYCLPKQSVYAEGENDGTSPLHAEGEKPSVERWSHLETRERQLYRCEICSMSHGIFADGTEGRLHSRASSSHGNVVRASAVQTGGSSSLGPQPEQQQDREPDAVFIERRAQAIRGFNTSLKPAMEPLILAMKPLDGTYAQNALKWGVGGLNIDECRIGMMADDAKRSARPGHSHKPTSEGAIGLGWSRDRMHAEQHPEGRWPANLLLSHHSSCTYTGTTRVPPEVWECHPDCPVRMLDEQAGDRPTGKLEPHHLLKESQNKSMSGKNYARSPRQSWGGESGGPSRFFYCSKVSTSERDLGLPKGTNRHSTLKPISLCRYLSSLLLPPARDPSSLFGPRKLLVPFSATGSEIAGALLAGWDEVWGVEMDAEWVEVAEKRIPAALQAKGKETIP